MISNVNIPKKTSTKDEDFIVEHYRSLLRVAKKSFKFSTYDQIPWGSRFILWRHDIDFSINRAFALATIEAEEGLTATYFINPRSEYYNPFEPSQANLIKNILSLGHKVGLHFDASFYDFKNEEVLSNILKKEASWLQDAFGVRPLVFSYHNPSEIHLKFDADYYAGMLNCYSRRMKEEVSYCSDSNGYWRYNRLEDVLVESEASCLQVLTHPGWWQETVMPPRQRVFRSVYGRAVSTMNGYDDALAGNNRINHYGVANLQFIKKANLKLFVLLDFMWNAEYLKSLFLEIWLLHLRQIKNLCILQLLTEWNVPNQEINALFEDSSISIDNKKLFANIFKVAFEQAAGIDQDSYSQIEDLFTSSINSRGFSITQDYKIPCELLLNSLETLAAWGQKLPIKYDGIDENRIINISTIENLEGELNNKFINVNENKCSNSINKFNDLIINSQIV